MENFTFLCSVRATDEKFKRCLLNFHKTFGGTEQLRSRKYQEIRQVSTSAKDSLHFRGLSGHLTCKKVM